MATKSCIAAVKKLTYSRVHISLDEVFSKILKQPCPQCKNESQGLIGKKPKTDFFFDQKKIQNGWLKKACFPAPPILNIFSPKFHGLVLQLVELIDAKGIGGAQPICTMIGNGKFELFTVWNDIELRYRITASQWTSQA